MMPPADEGRVVLAPLRLMSFNLRRDVAADGEDRWANRRDAAAMLIDRSGAHVIGTQEGLPGQLADLDARLPHHRRVGIGRDADGGDEHSAILYDARRVILVAWGDLWLSDTPNLPGSVTWGNTLPRIVTWARFTDQETGESFTVANTHLDHESAESRAKGAAFLAARFPDAIVMGDLNEGPGGEVWGALMPGRRDALASAPSPTFHAFTGSGLMRLDAILAPQHWVVGVARVLEDRVDGRLPSDHFPLVADLVPARPLAETMQART